MAIKNFWSLNVDEALTVDKLQSELKHQNWEVFYPLRAQLKDIDLILYNLKSGTSFSIQVKGSRSHTPAKREIARFGEGRNGWIMIKRDSIFKPTNKIDFFILLIHVEVQGKTKREIELHWLVLPTEKFKKILLDSNKAVGKGDLYNFFIWINPQENKAIEYSEWNNQIDLSPYLNNFDLIKNS